MTTGARHGSLLCLRSDDFRCRGLLVAGLCAVSCSSAAPSRPSSTAPASSSSRLVALPPGDRVEQTALGENHSCALLASGRVACWGANGMGQLGNGSSQSSVSPVLVQGVLDAVDIRASRATTCVRTKTGAVSCWGDNAYGQASPRFEPALTAASTPWGVYDARGEPPEFTPANVLRTPTSSDVAAGARSISLGYHHGCASYADGSVTCWGDASHGQLGASSGDAFQVQVIPAMPPLVEVSSALFYSCGRTADGRVWCWGANEQMQLGTADSGPRPREVPEVRGAVTIRLAANRACAWLDGGQAMCWGDSLDCGDDHPHAPVLVPELEGDGQFVRAAGECFWCVLKRGNSLTCDGDVTSQVQFQMPDVSSISAGTYHACAAKLDGSVWCWGGNPNGELGRETANVKDPEPAPVLWHPQSLDRPME